MKLKSFAYGQTSNAGNFESARFEVEVELNDEDLHSVLVQTKDLVREELALAVKEMQENRNKKISPFKEDQKESNPAGILKKNNDEVW